MGEFRPHYWSILTPRVTLIGLLTDNGLNRGDNFKLCEHFFITKPNDLTNHPCAKALTTALIGLLANNGLHNDDRQKIFNYYLDVNQRQEILIGLDHVFINLLANSKLQEPEVIRKVASRFDSGAINLPSTEQGIDFFIKLFDVENINVINILVRNLAYFIDHDGETRIKAILANRQLIKPLEQSEIENKVEEQLIYELGKDNSGIQDPVIREVLIRDLSNDVIMNQVDQEFKNLVNKILGKLINETMLNDLYILIRRLIDREYREVSYNGKVIMRASQVKLNTFKDRISSFIFNNTMSTPEQEKAVFELASSLVSMPSSTAQIEKIIKETYLPLLGIEENNAQESACKIIQQYLPWTYAVESCKKAELAEITQQIVCYDEVFVKSYPDLYFSYVLNTLPFRSYNNILKILKSNYISQKDKQKLELIKQYCELKELSEDDDNSLLGLFIVFDRQSEAPYLLHLQDLAYLNRNNLIGFNLELFEICTIANARIISRSLDLDIYKRIRLPEYLEQLISDKFTASNIVAQHQIQLIKSIINRDKLDVTPQQFGTLTEVCHQTALKINQYLTIPVEVKKGLMVSLKELELNVFDNNNNPGNYIGMKMALLTQLFDDKVAMQNISRDINIDDLKSDQIVDLPIMVLEIARKMDFSKGIDITIEGLHRELSKLDNVGGKVQSYHVAYMLGVIFMAISSVNVLGYEEKGNNVAFARFRLWVVYCLAKSIELGSNLFSKPARLSIGKAIVRAILSGECSGQITNSLYGSYLEQDLQLISDSVSDILQAKLV